MPVLSRKTGVLELAILKTMGGNSYTKARLYHDREANRGTKNLVWSNTQRQIGRMQKDVAEGAMTEEAFAEQQSDILSAFTEKWGDPTPPSDETDEDKQARRERKARKKAVDEKDKITAIAENGFIDGYTAMLTGTLKKEESDRIKALADPTAEVYNAIFKPFKEYLQYRYKTVYHDELRLLTTLEEGEDELLHTHHMLNIPLSIKAENRQQFLFEIEDAWKRYSGATIARAEEIEKTYGLFVVKYLSKQFFELRGHKKGKHYYWCTDNLRHIGVDKQLVDDNAVKTVIGKARQGEDELVAYLKAQPEMENKRVIDTYFHDAEDRIDDITFVELTIVDVTKDIEAGRLGKKRSAADIEVWTDALPIFARVNHYGESVTATEPKKPFGKREWVIDRSINKCEEQQNKRDNTPSAPIPQLNILMSQLDKPTPIPRYRPIMFCGLMWWEEMPTPQEGRRIVCSNGLIFDELDVDL